MNFLLSRSDSYLGLPVCGREAICLPNLLMLCHANVSGYRGPKGRKRGSSSTPCIKHTSSQHLTAKVELKMSF